MEGRAVESLEKGGGGWDALSGSGPHLRPQLINVNFLF